MRREWTAIVIAAACVPASCGGATTAASPEVVSSDRVLRRAPYAGVACPQAGSIRCDRVGLALWLAHDASRVRASIGGRALALARSDWRDERPPWIGYQPAGLLDGALRITPDRGRFHREGRHAKSARLVIDGTREDGSTQRTRLSAPLRAGWG